MTRDEATAEAQRRNVEEFRRAGGLGSVWAEFEQRPGVWNVGLYAPGPRPLWRRALRFAVELALEPDPHQDAGLPQPPRRVWRRRRVG